MSKKEHNRFFDVSSLQETVGIRQRASVGFLSEKLTACFPSHKLHVDAVTVNETGRYRKLFRSIRGLPPYCVVKVSHLSGGIVEHITVWTPLKWNDRFVGTGGGGASTGGTFYITRPDHTERGMTLPKAVINGFAAATTDAGNVRNNWGFDDGKLNPERIENWRSRSTHFMTECGKCVAELLHDRPVRFAYFHGGSGGGRQAMVEAQEHPEDYNGIWASCPAINWNRFLLLGFWPIAVMNSCGHTLSFAKMQFFAEAAQVAAGGKALFYRRAEAVSFDPHSVVGKRTKRGMISEKDASVMQMIQNGPLDENGNRIWYWFRPGVVHWVRILPIAALYYNLFGRPKPFPLCNQVARWIMRDEKAVFDHITIDALRALYRKSLADWGAIGADCADLSAFRDCGGKLIIDHGTDDPLIPVDGTLHYYRNVQNTMRADSVSSFMRVYITPGDGHGNCRWHGPGITESDGMAALIGWVENGIVPCRIQTVQTDRKGHIVSRGVIDSCEAKANE